jgi:hypothetical protein
MRLARSLTAFGSVALVLALALAWLAGSALGQVEAPRAAQAKHLFIAPTTVLHLSGTDLYCAVVPIGGKPFVSCFRGQLSAGAFKRTSYAIGLSDKYAAIDKTGTTKPYYLKFQPHMPAKLIAKGKAYGTARPVEVGYKSLLAVKGSHLAIAIDKTRSGLMAVVFFITWPAGSPVAGSYGMEMDAKHVGVFQFTKAGKAKALYSHAIR